MRGKIMPCVHLGRPGKDSAANVEGLGCVMLDNKEWMR